MKRLFFAAAITVLVAAVFASCSKDSFLEKEATYTGTFTITYASDIPERWLWESRSGETTLVLSDGRYSCSGNSDRIPAGGSGTYSVKNGKITFRDENAWTAEFDWGLILNGEYDYTLKGGKLKISRENEYARQEYDLEASLIVFF